LFWSSLFFHLLFAHYSLDIHSTFPQHSLNIHSICNGSGAAMKQHGAVFAHKFEKSFGGAFGVLLASLTELMLDPSPAARPNLQVNF
jgi:hypothetical protein